jgi:hypothetical protein
METRVVNGPEIEKIFDKLRKAGHGSVIKFDANESGQPVEGIIFEPVPRRPAGFEAGVFVMVPTDPEHVYYFDPESSREQKRLIIRLLAAKKGQEAPAPDVEGHLKEFEYLRQSPGVHIGGGATGEMHSKVKGIVDL